MTRSLINLELKFSSINSVNLSDQDKADAESFYKRFEAHFDNTWFEDIKGNKMLYWQKPIESEE